MLDKIYPDDKFLNNSTLYFSIRDIENINVLAQVFTVLKFREYIGVFDDNHLQDITKNTLKLYASNCCRFRLLEDYEFEVVR